MSKVRAHISVSTDGYVAGPNQSVENPLGEGGEGLHEWAFPLKSVREALGSAGGEGYASNGGMEVSASKAGAGVRGWGMLGGGPCRWGEEPWKVWWGEEKPFSMP